jgi:hypothetical protein
MEPDLHRFVCGSLAGRLFIALWGGLAVVDVSRPTGRLLTGALVVVLVAICGVGQSRPGAAVIATTGWLVINGFVQHRYGELGLGAASWALLGLVLAVVLVVAAGTAPGVDAR